MEAPFIFKSIRFSEMKIGEILPKFQIIMIKNLHIDCSDHSVIFSASQTPTESPRFNAFWVKLNQKYLAYG